MMRFVVTVFAALLLSACATTTAPSDDLSMPVSNKPVVQSLVSEAQTALAAGHPDDAARSLERALRIEPRNPVLWHFLGKTRVQQNRFDQAETLAAKSNTLAGTDNALRAANWRLIAQARSARGDAAGAAAAQAKADSLTQ